MNEYLRQQEKIFNPFKKEQQMEKSLANHEKEKDCSVLTISALQHSSIYKEGRTKVKHISQQSNNTPQIKSTTKPQQKKIVELQASIQNNFYQTYINLFVNFFNLKSQEINVNSIKSIIRPNNRFVLIDLLKALFQFLRNDFRNYVRDAVFYDSKLLVKVNDKKQSQQIRSSLHKEKSTNQLQIIVDDQIQQKSRRVNTQPQRNSPLNTVPEPIQQKKISPVKQFRTKHSIANFIKHQSSQPSKIKNQQAEQLSNQYLHAHFIDQNIKQTMYERNLQFVSEVNLFKLENKVNALYFELHKLNFENKQIITKYYENNLGRKNKFNYDSRGLYSESEIQVKKSLLTQDIDNFQQQKKPNHQFTHQQIAQYASKYFKFKNKCEQFYILDKFDKKKQRTSISSWIPIRIQYSESITQPLRVDIQDRDQNTQQTQYYHWKKYNKQISISEYLKQKVKAEYQRVQSKSLNLVKMSETQALKKIKFRKSLFVDNRKKVYQLLQSNNVIFTKKQSLFPVLKGIQENYLKNNAMTFTVLQSGYPCQRNSKSKQYKWDRIDNRSRGNNYNMKSNSHFQEYGQSQKHFELIKKTSEIKDISERKSQSQKMFDKIQDKERYPDRQKYPQREKIQILSKMNIKYDLPTTTSHKQKHSDKYEKKNLVSMSKIVDLRQQLIYQNSNIKYRELTEKKLAILNII